MTFRYNLDGSSALERNELLALLEDLMQVSIIIMVAFWIEKWTFFASVWLHFFSLMVLYMCHVNNDVPI